MTTSLFQELGLTPDEQAFLEKYHFNAEVFATLQHQLQQGEFPRERNAVTKKLAPPNPEDLLCFPDTRSEEFKDYEAQGKAAIANGELAILVLNGGMATRFGGVVKGVVPVIDGKSFLGLKIENALHAEGHVPVFLMNSFATEEKTKEHLKENAYFGMDPNNIHALVQRIAIRLTPEGSVHRNQQEKVDFYAPGHGDVLEVLHASKAFQTFKKQGGRIVWISNVDNLAAMVHPAILGAHLQTKHPVTVETVSRSAADTGGAPARVDGHLEIVEGFRFPKDFSISSIPVFSTNTFLFNVDAIKPDYPLTWFRADKSACGMPVVQFERLIGEATAFVDASFLSLPRDGAQGRFLPVKTPEDLEAVRPILQTRLRQTM